MRILQAPTRPHADACQSLTRQDIARVMMKECDKYVKGNMGGAVGDWLANGLATNTDPAHHAKVRPAGGAAAGSAWRLCMRLAHAGGCPAAAMLIAHLPACIFQQAQNPLLILCSLHL